MHMYHQRHNSIIYATFFLMLFIHVIPLLSFAQSSSFSIYPQALPVLSPSEAQKANIDAISFFHQMSSIESDNNDSVSYPFAVPVLSIEEAKAANIDAIRFVRKDKIFRQLRFFRDNKVVLFLLILLIPFFYLFLLVPRKRNNQTLFSFQRRIHILSSFTLLFLGIIIFVPWSVYFGNTSQFSFIFQDFFLNDLLLFAISVILCSSITILIPPPFSDCLVSIIGGLGLCIYIQSMFMNCFLGMMNGAQIDWNQHFFWGCFNIAVWVAIIIIPFIIKKHFATSFIHVNTAAFSVIILLELVASVSMIISAPKTVWHRDDSYYCNSQNLFQFSKEKNILFIVFDQLGGGLINHCFDADPDVKKVLKDFTWYDDARFLYDATFPALVHELTGAYIQPGENQRDVYDKAWHSPSASSFYSQLNDADYDSRIFIKSHQNIGFEEFYYNYFSNIEAKDIYYTIDSKKLRSCLTSMSFFSSLPYFLKRCFFYGDDFSNGVVQQYVGFNSSNSIIPYRNETFYQALQNTKITTDAEKPVMSIFYTRGAHPPWDLDEKCNRHDPPYDEDILPSARSCFFLLSELVRALQEQSIYDQTTIVVCSDHGSRTKYSNVGDMTLMIKHFNESHSEIIKDNSKVSSIDILPTILYLACGTNADYKSFDGFPIPSIPSNRQRKIFFEMNRSFCPPFYGSDGIPLQNINCQREHLFDNVSSFNWEKSFVRYIPWNINAVVDEKTLTTF